MKKKLTVLLSVCICILALAACGADPKEMDYNGMTYQELEEYANGTWWGIYTMDKMQLAAAVAEIDAMSEMERIRVMEANEGLEEQFALIKSWLSVSEQAGDYIGVNSFEVTVTGKTTTTDLYLDFERHPVVLSVVYNNRDMSVETVTVDLEYSMGEKMQKAAMNTVMGMGTVFVMLIIICLIISCFAVIPKIEKKLKDRKKSKEKEAYVPEFVYEIPKAEVSLTEEYELVAVIAAAIAAYTGQTTDDFVVRSIKRR